MVLNHYSDMKDTNFSDLLIQANINTEKQLMTFSGYSWQDFPYTVKSAGSSIIFYLGGPIDHVTHVLVPFAQSSA